MIEYAIKYEISKDFLLVVTFAIFYGLINLERIDYDCFYFYNKTSSSMWT